jgi:pyruvate/2-oxoglutarate dehydrogenase complex dihydrolipoamide acyltransferase (E2) component
LELKDREKSQVSSNSDSKTYEYVKIHNARWNLIDMINLVAKPSVPATLFYEIDMSWSEDLRKRYTDAGHKISITAILIKAIAIAQRNHPASRTVWVPDSKLLQINRLEAQFTVERFIDEQPALFFGTVRMPDLKPIIEINNELQAYATDPIESVPQLAIEHRFSRFPWFIRQIVIFLGMRIPHIRLEYMGATFGISSLGKYGCRNMISPSVITSMFCVGEVKERPVAVDGQVVIRPILSLVLNFDHRVIDGASAARFVTDIIKLLQGDLEEYVKDEVGSFDSNSQSTAKELQQTN